MEPIEVDFRWRTRKGEWVRPKEMATTHLFYVLRMIWNHTMPAEAQLSGGRYKFTPTYTVEYMKTAAWVLYRELCRRDDLPTHLHWQLTFMKRHARRLRGERNKAQ